MAMKICDITILWYNIMVSYDFLKIQLLSNVPQLEEYLLIYVIFLALDRQPSRPMVLGFFTRNYLLNLILSK